MSLPASQFVSPGRAVAGGLPRVAAGTVGPGPVGRRRPAGVEGDIATGAVTCTDQWQDSNPLGRAAEPNQSEPRCWTGDAGVYSNFTRDSRAEVETRPSQRADRV
jgi:hypothetical protein